MNIIRTEQIWLKPNKTIGRMCHLSKNLYNEANYIVRQELDKNGRWIRFYELDKILNGVGSNPSENYKQLPSGTAQWILKLLDRNWKSFFNSMREWKKNPNKFMSMPKPPKYKKKNGENILIFTNSQVKIRNGYLSFPKKLGKLKVKTRLDDNTDLREVRIVPKGVGYVCEIAYRKEFITPETDKSRVVGIDFGSANIVTMVNNIGKKPIVIKDNGKGIKSINQFYNKKKAELCSIYSKQGIKTGDKLRRLKVKRDKKVNDYIHKLSRFIVDWCEKNKIGTIVIGRNREWKYKVNLGKQNNQTFVYIPFGEIIEKITYKAEEKGIQVILQEESHTSKCSFLDNEPIEHHDKYVGKRITRSLFKSANGTIIHADVNGAYNIVKKAIPKAFSNECQRIGGCGLHPLRYYVSDKILCGI